MKKLKALASMHTEHKDDQTTTHNTPSELSNMDKDTGAEDGDVCSNYGEVARSTGVEASTSCPIYEDEGVLEPNYDVDLAPYPIYDMYDDAGMIVPKYDKGWKLCMKDDRSKILYEDEVPSLHGII
jgi:hypothetical protein